MKIAFFDAKPYDKPSFDKYGEASGIEFKYFETKLNEDTAELANGYDGVCVFVNDTVNAPVIDKLVKMGIKIVALRCAGFNNVDMKYAFGKLHVLRVPAYSPYAVAEHTMAMLLTSIRRIHKAYIRTRDFNFSLSGLTGFDLHGKTVGVIGTGKIGKVFIDICRLRRLHHGLGGLFGAVGVRLPEAEGRGHGHTRGGVLHSLHQHHGGGRGVGGLHQGHALRL